MAGLCIASVAAEDIQESEQCIHQIFTNNSAKKLTPPTPQKKTTQGHAINKNASIKKKRP